MSSGIYSALSGAVAQERNLSVVANNVANVSTHGFKADRVAFNEALADQAKPEPERSVSLKYAALNRVQVDLSEGSLQQTGNPLDFALLGDGFFTVRNGEGEQYTRAGAFMTDAKGVVRNHHGDRLMIEGGAKFPQGKELVVPEGTMDVTLGEDGTVNADGAVIGKLRLRSFARPEDMEKVGVTNFVPRDGTVPGAAQGVQSIQGSLETANLNAVRGLNEMITLSRSFDVLQRVIQTFKEMDSRTARDIGSR